MINIDLNKPLVFLDLETTGLNTSTDRIVDITLIKVHPDGQEESKTRLINPEMHIPEESTKVHGITDEKVKDEPTFKQIAKSFNEFLEDCDLCGFNIKGFDLPLLINEFQRAGIQFSKANRRIIDTQVIFHKYHPRNLEAAYQRYCNKELENSHSSDADARASMEILISQLEVHSDLPGDMDGLHEFCCFPEESNWVDVDGKFIWNIEGEILCNFGKKYKGRYLRDIANEDPSYLGWILNNDFSDEVKHLVSQALNGNIPIRDSL